MRVEAWAEVRAKRAARREEGRRSAIRSLKPPREKVGMFLLVSQGCYEKHMVWQSIVPNDPLQSSRSRGKWRVD